MSLCISIYLYLYSHDIIFNNCLSYGCIPKFANFLKFDLSTSRENIKLIINNYDMQTIYRLQNEGEKTKYIGTQLGLAVLASGLSPDEGLHVFSELHRARKCFVLENELQLVYQVRHNFRGNLRF